MQKWHQRMLNMAIEAATWSKDRSTKVGAALFRDRHLICTGFNGFPRGVDDDVISRHQKPTKYRFTKHAEENAILCAARLGIQTEGAHMIITAHPCCGCMASIIQAGIKRVICPPPWDDPDDTFGFAEAVLMAEEAKVEMLYFDPKAPHFPSRGE